MRISKSKFMAGVQCLKRLYWEVHEPELAGGSDAATEALFEQGHEVGLLACQLFPGGVEVDGSEGMGQAIRATRELVANHEIPAIFEATFENGGVLVRVDVLQRRSDSRWRLLEVKSTTDLKDRHLDDVGIQALVVSRCGLNLASSDLMHVNRDYVFDGDSIDAREFFSIKNLTRHIASLESKLTTQIQTELEVLSKPTPPEIASGSHCDDPFTCEFYDRCNLSAPEGHISYLPRISAKSVARLKEMGVESIRDIPGDFPLSERQRIACTSVQTGQPWFSPELKKEFRLLKYPLCFMDFETVNPAIPRFKGMRPYDMIPFQWSVHTRRKPEAQTEHHEFLAMDNTDPRREFISSLCNAVGEKGNIVVYNATFESQRLSDLATWLPEFAQRIEAIQSRLFDLLPITRQHVYHPAFGGSFSLKAVLPALVPELTYEGMAVGNGEDAGLAWNALVRGGLNQAESEKIRKALLDYCGQDTLALVRVLDVLLAASTTAKAN